MIAPLSVDLRLLRTLLASETRLTPGRALMVRVVSADGQGRGSLSLAGTVLEAELPRHVRAGDELRLVVRDVSAERVLLVIADPGAVPGTAPAPAPLPGGGTVRPADDDAAGAGGAPPPGVHTLALRYDAPALGSLDLRFVLGPGGLRLDLGVAAGNAHELTAGAAGDLRQRLAEALGRPVEVTVRPRREPLDLYA